MSRYSVSTWYISRTIEVVSKLTVMVIFMCHIFSALRVTKNIAHRDPLTNIFNRNYFFNELTVQSASAQKTPYCVMIMDIDHFKKSTTHRGIGWRSGDKNSGEYHWEKHTTR